MATAKKARQRISYGTFASPDAVSLNDIVLFSVEVMEERRKD
jgi:hypothetical protein